MCTLFRLIKQITFANDKFTGNLQSDHQSWHYLNRVAAVVIAHVELLCGDLSSFPCAVCMDNELKILELRLFVGSVSYQLSRAWRESIRTDSKLQ